MSLFESFLTEHVIVNPEVVDVFARRYALGLTTPETRKWIIKRIRQKVMNDEFFLTRMSGNDISTTPGVPTYALAASERGEPVYAFTIKDSVPEFNDFTERCQNLNHFLIGLESAGAPGDFDVTVEQKRASEKLLSKLSRMTFEQAEQAHEEWSRLFSSASKEGVDVVHKFDDGYHWVRYTELATMKADGEDLQNCLRQGMYWDRVEKGTMQIFGLRNPKGEAVVGLALSSGGAVSECKGKQNKEIDSKYVDYVIAFLDGRAKKGNYDTERVGILFSNGRVGTFEALATKFEKDGWVVAIAPQHGGSDKVVVRQGEVKFVFTAVDGKIMFFDGKVVFRADDGMDLDDMEKYTPEKLAAAVNASGLKPGSNIKWENHYGLVKTAEGLLAPMSEACDEVLPNVFEVRGSKGKLIHFYVGRDSEYTKGTVTKGLVILGDERDVALDKLVAIANHYQTPLEAIIARRVWRTQNAWSNKQRKYVHFTDAAKAVMRHERGVLYENVEGGYTVHWVEALDEPKTYWAGFYSDQFSTLDLAPSWVSQMSVLRAERGDFLPQAKNLRVMGRTDASEVGIHRRDDNTLIHTKKDWVNYIKDDGVAITHNTVLPHTALGLHRDENDVLDEATQKAIAQACNYRGRPLTVKKQGNIARLEFRAQKLVAHEHELPLYREKIDAIKEEAKSYIRDFCEKNPSVIIDMQDLLFKPGVVFLEGPIRAHNHKALEEAKRISAEKKDPDAAFQAITTARRSGITRSL